ncbi:MAG: hypothetical protein ACLQBB_08525 [Solirubrobacteraceae bacterium]
MARHAPSGLEDAPAGVLYSAAGAAHIAEAVRSARSSLRHNRLPHLLFASEAAESVPGLSVERFEPSENPYADKIANMRRSPFQRTIYLDTDTFVVDEITDVLELLDRYELAAAHAAGYRGMRDPEVPRAFYELNTGVIAWRTGERTAAFMRSWQETYLAWAREPPFAAAGGVMTDRPRSRGGAADQPAFRHCAWQHDMRLYVLAPEYNLRLGEPATVVERVRVIHGRHPDYEGLAARINDRHGPRRWPRPAPVRARALRFLRGGRSG